MFDKAVSKNQNYLIEDMLGRYAYLDWVGELPSWLIQNACTIFNTSTGVFIKNKMNRAETDLNVLVGNCRLVHTHTQGIPHLTGINGPDGFEVNALIEATVLAKNANAYATIKVKVEDMIPSDRTLTVDENDCPVDKILLPKSKLILVASPNFDRAIEAALNKAFGTEVMVLFTVDQIEEAIEILKDYYLTWHFIQGDRYDPTMCSKLQVTDAWAHNKSKFVDIEYDSISKILRFRKYRYNYTAVRDSLPYLVVWTESTDQAQKIAWNEALASGNIEQAKSDPTDIDYSKVPPLSIAHLDALPADAIPMEWPLKDPCPRCKGPMRAGDYVCWGFCFSCLKTVEDQN